MTTTGPSFHELEQAGWEQASVVSAYHEHLATVTAQSVVPLLDAAGVCKGSRILDVATGPGFVAAAAAQRGADAIGIDFSSAQVRMARELHPLVRFEQADAEALPFEPDSFDAVVNAYGMCHLPNPDAALREAFRVLKRGGRVAFTVWDTPERTVGLGAVYAAVRAHGSIEVGLPAGPSFFLFSDPEQSARVLRNAGFDSPSCRQVPQVWRIADPETLFEVLTTGTVRAAAMLRAQSAGARDAIRAALRTTVMEYRRGEYFDIPMPAVLATAVKPGL
ncbi:MAG TPA: methyltransferase domain-containing protein [Gemmataceae bacterium]|nr:methyltransferase domain-containing protein [Gemmataceae bacterium]